MLLNAKGHVKLPLLMIHVELPTVYQVCCQPCTHLGKLCVARAGARSALTSHCGMATWSTHPHIACQAGGRHAGSADRAVCITGKAQQGNEHLTKA